MHPLLIIRLLVLLLLANGTPMMAGRLLGTRLAHPIDGGLEFLDGRALFGRSKTIRGVVLAILVTIAGAPLVGFSWRIGLLTSSLAMAGDLFSSFCKRRLGLTPSSPAVGLDQVPEALFPLLACTGPLSLTLADVAAGVVIFFVGELLLSRLLYAFDLRDRPY
ncbi:MAG TPA: CDP-archaeol synthase [Stellaceae bacterium]|jgi:CDP-diglyceride synthetase|nr:CDP-archaeol synthase [Stellaceae bacterium]